MSKKLPIPGKMPLPADPTQLAKAVQDVVGAYKEWKIVHEQEVTKRETIGAQRDALVEKIRADRAIMVDFLKGRFEQQGATLDGLFERLDTALAMRDPSLVAPILSSIVETVKTSPLGDLVTLDQRMKENSFTFVLGKD